MRDMALIKCPECGKEISERAKSCPNCGKQVRGDIFSFFAKNKSYISLYGIWVFIHLLLLLYGNDKVHEGTLHEGCYEATIPAKSVFYPFTLNQYSTSFLFNSEYYDITEFIIYCFVIPLINYLIVINWEKISNKASVLYNNISQKLSSSPQEKSKFEYDLTVVEEDTVLKHIDVDAKEEKQKGAVDKKTRRLLVFICSCVFLIILGFIAKEMGKKTEPNLLDKLNVTSTKKTINYEEELRIAIKDAKTVLPKAIDYYTEWTNIVLKKDYVELIYVIYDENIDIYEIDLSERKEEIQKNLSSLLDKRFLEACVNTKRGINYHIRYSQSIPARGYVNITFGNHEIEGILDDIDLK